jgi:hypothetical protein
MTRTPLAPLFTGMTAAALLALGGCSKPAEQPAASAEPTAPSSEYVAENPTEPAVDVNLPASSATTAPAATASPAEAAPPPAAK